jgi:DNA repair protein RadA/Sms
VRLDEIKSDRKDRLDTGIGELNRVLGGGIVKGSLTLIAGEPGICKSTLILQTADNIAKNYGQVLYVSGEESEEQIKMRGDRIIKTTPDNLFLLSETNIEIVGDIVSQIRPNFLIIDSIQTMYTDTLDAAPGSVSQIRSSTNELMKIGKVMNIPIFIVAHVTKSGELAGPKIIEHLVDCVLQFTGDRNQDLRILRANKNRFGTTSEIGAFEMKEEGLVEVDNLSASFLEGLDEAGEGSIATAVYEGTRPLLLELQALTSTANAGFPRRTAIGVDINRLNMIVAVLERRAGINLSTQDIYVNVVGGLKPEGTSIDLAVALAIYSSLKGIDNKGKTLAIGEIGLTGDLRPVRHADKIANEATRMGFKNIILPKKNAGRLSLSGINVIGISNIREACSKL